ncbi:deoxyribonuclease IV [Candidatus Methylacidiphilum fumarolicum]|nr:deoxyribonuclease IV [Candidatus Methylacidiphilum fumarolicum]CAI9085812.1 putative endonuclease 4 [Candidatus Methylacidiphilum fumarolicum]
MGTKERLPKQEMCQHPLLPAEIKSRLVGAHVSIAGGFRFAVLRAKACGFSAAQIFLKNCRRWEDPIVDPEDIAQFLSLKEKYRIFFFGHFSYLINLCASTEQTAEKSIHALLQEMAIASKLTLPFVVLHPGSSAVEKTIEAIEVLSTRLNLVMEMTEAEEVKIALETMAGQGGQIGRNIEQLKAIFERLNKPERFCFCLDTAHLWEAGYDVKSKEGYEELIEKISAALGLSRIAAFHLNDSSSPFGSNVDRHAHIGEGTIGLEPFRRIMEDSRFASLPMVLETPKENGVEADCQNLRKILVY